MVFTKIEPKKSYIKLTTSNPSEMRLRWLAKNVYRTREEDLFDEDTGEHTVVERKEILFLAWTFIDDDVLTKIRFFMQEGSIKEVTVANQRREGYRMESYNVSSFIINATVDDRTKKILLRATGVENAIEIFTDYAETRFNEQFRITSVKEIDGFIVTENLMRIDAKPIVARYEEGNLDYQQMFLRLLSDLIPSNCEEDFDEFVRKELDSSWKQLTLLYKFVLEDKEEERDENTATDLFNNPIPQKEAKKTEEDEEDKKIEYMEQSFIANAETTERAIEICATLIKLTNDAYYKKHGEDKRKLVYKLKKAAPFSASELVPMELSEQYFNKK